MLPETKDLRLKRVVSAYGVGVMSSRAARHTWRYSLKLACMLILGLRHRPCMNWADGSAKGIALCVGVARWRTVQYLQ